MMMVVVDSFSRGGRDYLGDLMDALHEGEGWIFYSQDVFFFFFLSPTIWW